MTNNKEVKKPIQLRVVFILNALMMILPFVFYGIITSKGIEIGGIPTVYMIYTGIAYILSFAILVYSILNKKFNLFRFMFLINVLIATPAKAYLGILVAIISIILSFNGKIKNFFGV